MPTFTIMTWNVENLFHLPAGAPEDDLAVYAAKLTLLAEVIERHSPDVVALQEVGGIHEEDGIEPLQDLHDALGGAYPHTLTSTLPDGRGIRVAMLSRLEPVPGGRLDFANFPAGEVFSLGGNPPVTRMGRGGLQVRFAAAGVDIDVIAVHLKSKLLSYRRPNGSTAFSPSNEQERADAAALALMRRGAEAATVRVQANLLIEGNDDANVVVLGDLNDVPDAQTSLILNGPPGSEIGTRGFDTPDRGDDARLFNLAPLIPEESRYSRIHRGRGELLDQILVSEGLMPLQANGDRRVPVVLSDVDFAGGLPSVTENPNPRADEAIPDHAPVIATFELG